MTSDEPPEQLEPWARLPLLGLAWASALVALFWALAIGVVLRACG